MGHYLGIDIGTSGCKAVAFDDEGRQVSMAYRGYEIIVRHPGRAELDTDEVIGKCFEVIRESASRLTPGSVKGLGISSQGEAFTLVDRNGKALCNAQVSSDSRAHEMIANWTKEFNEERLYRITGHTPHPMFSLFKLLWMKENEPEIWANAHRILCFEDLLQFRLGIETPSMGWPLAGRTMLFDVISHKWHSGILEQAGIKQEQLSIPLPSGTIAGYVDSKMARDLHLADFTPVVTGGHDQVCSALGAGAIEPGLAVYASGTVECITPAFDKPVFSPELHRNNLCTYDHAIPGLYATVAFALTGGNLLKWYIDEFGDRETGLALLNGLDPFSLMLDRMPDEPARPLVLPYFTQTGTPYFDVAAKGAIIGLDFSVTREEILRALMEGVAFEIRLNLEILKQSGYQVNELRIIGGGARSAKLVQLKADVTGMPITTLDVTEAGCLGVAMLAKAACTGTNVREIALEWVRPVSRIEPNLKKHYEAKFNSYKQLYPMLRGMV